MRFTVRTLLVLLLAAGSAAAEPMTLEYVGYYEHQSTGADHLVDVISIDAQRAVVGGNMGLALVDLAALPPEGTTDYLDWLRDIHARNIYQLDDQYLFVNLFGGVCEHGSCGPGGSPGFSVVKVEGNTLRLIATREETDALFEKMFIQGDRLYVTAHGKGIRIYDISDPENPQQIGRLDTGFVDAWAIAVEGNTAWVADGAGGLKIVDVTDPAAPLLIDGEDLDTAKGTAQDVLVRDGRIYVAAGGPGVAVYTQGDLGSRRIHPIGAYTKDLDWIGTHLAVATYGSLAVMEPGPGTELTVAIEEIAQRRGPLASVRLCSAVAAAPGDRLLAANWDFMDVYRLMPASQGSQPDINSSVQRIRFHKDGGTHSIRLWNNGQGTLQITNVRSSLPTFTVGWTGGTLAPGESVSFDVSYVGSSVNTGTAEVEITSNDPDESPMVIRVFGNTDTLDPGDPVPDFTRLTIEKNPVTGGLEEGGFTLSDHRGQVVWFNVFSSW